MQSLKVLQVIFSISLVIPCHCITRTNTANTSDSNRRQQQGSQGPPPPVNNFRPVAQAANPPPNQGPPVPSQDLIPPLFSPPGPSQPQPQSDGRPQQLQPQSPATTGEKFDLLPPLEIPPEFPIGNPPLLQSPIIDRLNEVPNTSGGVKFQVSDAVSPPSDFQKPFQFRDKFLNSQSQQSNGQPQPPPQQPARPIQPQAGSFLPTTGSGSNPSSVPGQVSFNSVPQQNQVVTPNFNQQQRPFQQFNQGLVPTTSQITTPDPGQACLGSCGCPGHFDFVCGANGDVRILYQNDCALECDKKCFPGLVKVPMDQCQR